MKEKKYDTVIFDLDGTLLNTLEDLSDSVNHALRTLGMPVRTLEEIRRFVGNGVLRLMELSVPEGRKNPQFEQAYGIFKEYYSGHCMDKTGVYEKIPELLLELSKRGYRMAIVSNKYQGAVQELKNTYFAGTVEAAIGERDGLCRKPAPDMVWEALKALKSSRERSVYVGDSEVDIATAANAGMDCIAVGWGFRTREEQKKAGAKCFAADPFDILKLV